MASKEAQGNFYGVYLSLIVNYSNLLHRLGRIVVSIEVLRSIEGYNFPMAMSSYAFKIIDYSRLYYDPNHMRIICNEAYKCFQDILKNDEEYPEKKEQIQMMQTYIEDIKKFVDITFLRENYSLHDLITPFKEFDDNELEYREWCTTNNLSLHILNDIFEEIDVAYDPIHLPSMTEKIGENKVKSLHGLFNQIKQEYVSARFLAYDGVTSREMYYSDKKVFLVDTLDFPNYGLWLEKIKASYRCVYSIFDKIGYFLNEYFELGIKKSDVSFVRVWSRKKTQNDEKKLSDILENNYPLLGLWWLYKDIRNVYVSDSKKHIDPIMSKITSVRNHMEHKYLKILDYDGEAGVPEDSLAYNIGFEEFEELTVSLLKYVREAIILLSFIIHVEETSEHNHPEDKIATVSTFEYNDEWKR